MKQTSSVEKRRKPVGLVELPYHPAFPDHTILACADPARASELTIEQRLAILHSFDGKPALPSYAFLRRATEVRLLAKYPPPEPEPVLSDEPHPSDEDEPMTKAANTKAAKTKAAKGATQKAKVGERKPDGPVAQARAIFDKMHGKDTAAIKAACVAAGINPGTTAVQLGRWRKENDITVAKAKPAAKKSAKATKPATKAATPAPKQAKAPKEGTKAAAKKPATKPATKAKKQGKTKAAKSTQQPAPAAHLDLTPDPDPKAADTSAGDASTHGDVGTGREPGEDAEETQHTPGNTA